MNKNDAQNAAIELTKALLQSNTNKIIVKNEPQTFFEQANLIADFVIYLAERLENGLEADPAHAVQVHVLDTLD